MPTVASKSNVEMGKDQKVEEIKMSSTPPPITTQLMMEIAYIFCNVIETRCQRKGC